VGNLLNSQNRGRLLVVMALAGLAAGGVFWWREDPAAAHASWTIATAPVLVALLVEIVTSLRRGNVGLDIVAALSMSAALAFGEPLAGNVVALMYAGGQLLEAFAEGRARAEMTALLGRVARTAMRFAGTQLEEVPIAELRPGDRLLIREGEVLPVDGRVVKNAALLDLSALTGESLPEAIVIGGEASSGATSIGSAFELTALRSAAESTYAGIVRLVEAAQTSKAPMVRLADRYAIGFLLLTLIISGGAWIVSGDPIRALAVLVVATPCPLILAVPVAIISGLSRTAKIGVLIKNGGVLETLARVRTAVFDKTGTLTHGEARISAVHTAPGFSEGDILRMTASLEQGSGHVLASALIKEAVRRDLILTAPTDISESPGSGIVGRVEGQVLAVGAPDFVRGHTSDFAMRAADWTISPEAATVAVSIDNRLAGTIVLADVVRHDAKDALAKMRRAGINRIILASGDRAAIAESIGAQLAVDESLGDLTPADKLAIVAREAKAATVMMIGDGVNDAPALAAADVGVALAARGAAASSEAAGVVVLVDGLAPLAEAVRIAQRTRVIALQSVFVGLGLSLAAMLVAAAGYLPPLQGALLQEAIDVAVILNALRALR
jgi:heavy metal translocating P-type ATPase